MAMDSYSQALQSRRGKSLDGSLMRVGEIDAPHGGIDHRLGVHGEETPSGEGAGTPHAMEPTAFDRESKTHLDEHIEGKNEHETPSPPASHHSMTHEDEHTMPVGEDSGTPYPRSQSPGMGGGDLEAEIRSHVIGHTSENEHEQLEGMKPRSLGERAKMGAMKSKFSPSGDGKKG